MNDPKEITTLHRLRRVRPDGMTQYYGLDDDLVEAMSMARELVEWSFTKSRCFVQRWRENNTKLDWEVEFTEI